MKIIPLSRGYITVVDEDDYDDLSQYNWYALVMGPHTVYACRDIRRDGKRVCEYMHSRLTGYPMTDHANGLSLDNRRENLRRTTYVQNNRNARSRVGSSSKYLGVTWYKRGGKWMARIQDGDKRTHLGYHIAEEDAARAYDRAAFARDPQFCRLNFPEEHKVIIT
jgi:hypothetical protein